MMIKIEVYVSTNLVGSEVTDIIEFDDNAFEGLTDSERDDMMNEAAREWMFEHIEWGFDVLKEAT